MKEHRISWLYIVSEIGSSKTDIALMYINNQIPFSDLANEIGSSNADLVHLYKKQKEERTK